MFRLSSVPLALSRMAALGAFLLVLGFSMACNGSGETFVDTTATPGVVVRFPSPSGEVTPRPRKTAVPTQAPTPTPLKVCSPNPDPAPASILQVLEPRPEQQVKVPFHVRGWGSSIGVDERGVVVGLVNAKQEVVQVLDVPPQPRTFRIAPAGLQITDSTRPFGADIVLDNIKAPTPVCVWVYLETNEEGVPRGVVQVPVMVVP